MSAVSRAIAAIRAEQEAGSEQAQTVASAVAHFQRVAELHPEWPAQLAAYNALCTYGHLDPAAFKAAFEGIDLAVSEVIAQRFGEATR